jgi:hypothetical protein
MQNPFSTVNQCEQSGIVRAGHTESNGLNESWSIAGYLGTGSNCVYEQRLQDDRNEEDAETVLRFLLLPNAMLLDPTECVVTENTVLIYCLGYSSGRVVRVALVAFLSVQYAHEDCATGPAFFALPKMLLLIFSWLCIPGQIE